MGSEKQIIIIDELPGHPPLTDLPEPQIESGTVIEIQTPPIKSKSWAEVFAPRSRAVLEMTADQRAKIFEILRPARERIGMPGSAITKGETGGDWLYFEYDNDETSNVTLPSTAPEYPAILEALR